MVFGLFEGGLDLTVDKANYRFGEMVTGIITCQLKERKEANALKVHVYGEQSRTTMTSKGVRRTTVKVYDGVVEAAGKQSYQDEQYKFEIALPPNPANQAPQGTAGALMGALDSLSGGMKGAIRWYVEAHLDVPMAIDFRKKKQINVVYRTLVPVTAFPCIAARTPSISRPETKSTWMRERAASFAATTSNKKLVRAFRSSN